MSEKAPGLILYPELLDALEEYEHEERSMFIYAMRDYRLYGVVPDFPDRGLRALWKQAVRSLESDDEHYRLKCRKNRYNAYVSTVKRKFPKAERDKLEEGVDYLSFEVWCIEVDESSQANVSERLPPLTDGSQQQLQPQLQQQPQPQPQPQQEKHHLEGGGFLEEGVGGTSLTDGIPNRFLKTLIDNGIIQG